MTSRKQSLKRLNASTPLLQTTHETSLYNSVDIVVDKNLVSPTHGRHNSGADEKWTDAGKLPTFTVADAQKMEWDYAHVVDATRRTSSVVSTSNAEFESSLDMEDNEDLTVLLDPFYDVTTGRLKRMFRHFSPHGEERVTYDAFHSGLTALGISPPADESFDSFVRKIDADHDGSISLDEFIHVVQMVKQAHLFRPEHEAEDAGSTAVSIMRVVDYSPTSIHTVAPVKKLQNFMFSSKPAWAKVRWVHVAGFRRADDINLRRLAIKYQLHPLALEDCLNQDDVMRCKYEHYEDHAFLCIPVIRPVDQNKKASMETYINRHRYDLFAKDRSLGLRERTSSASTLSSTKDKMSAAAKRADCIEKLETLRLMMRKPQQLCVFVHKDNHVVSVQEESDVDDASGFPLWHLVVRNQMNKSYSKLRNHEASFLVISIVNAVVDEMLPLVMVYEVLLVTMGKLLRIEATKFQTKRLVRAKTNLIALEKIVRPLQDLGEVKNYLRDVKDHLKQMTNSLKESQQTLAALFEEEKQIRQEHKDDVLYIMTISATLFLPGTFMTGLYGMNFDNMPELHTEYGYFVWWAAFLTIVTSLFTYLRFVKKWI
ncbi:Aste57867_12620 [Aphanomyces stellatus]|uniref:Aste57867_12620 protein n=1 Tax=Aphanomyces stellatus TaxID=120398 RepID=A0A485KY27_9STRA|nr:hypothetical protein As57867_012574 [Aphanomyces stellatus]VFT89470.1 Aste57867_12620 [Aphanomyces stellatus]